MSSCLGIYIENGLIKYAKVAKERDIIKLEAFGVKFYDSLEESIEQIVNETFSFNIPISVNINNEKYNYFEMFSLLSEKDMTQAINTEFELLCDEKGLNKNSLETRYLTVNNQENRDKTKAMHISCNKSEIERLNQLFQKYKLKAIIPMPVAIANNVEIGVKENAAILNLEESISLTTIINGQINKVQVFDNGMDEIYEKINKKENSQAKVYDVLKNTTIYTSEGKDLSDDSNDNYLQDIMPTLYDIINIVKENLTQNINNIDKLYITGTGAVINNIDLYFQEFLQNTKCEILKPYFLKNSAASMMNIRDYIEVNSAIALGLYGIDSGLKTINFKGSSVMEKLKELGSMEIGGKKNKSSSNKKGINKSINLSFDLNEKLDKTEINMLRLCGSVFLGIIIYIIAATIITNMINQKRMEAAGVVSDTNTQINKINNDMQTINDKTSYYETLISKLEEINQKIADENSVKNAVPNLMSRIMVHIPKDIQVTSIRNTTEKHVVIDVQAKEYDPIGYFLGAINTNGILVNAKSNSGEKQNGIIRITIEGDMP